MSPLGLENYMITDDQISASSFVGTGREPSKARLHNIEAWQSDSANIPGDWIQVDFKKVQYYLLLLLLSLLLSIIIIIIIIIIKNDS